MIKLLQFGYTRWQSMWSQLLRRLWVAVGQEERKLKLSCTNSETCSETDSRLLQKQKQCPVCRAKLVGSTPLIPNIAMDSLIERHIEQLSSVGDPGWQPQGLKFKERALRKECVFACELLSLAFLVVLMI
jgi:hypothetical protein